MINRVTVKIVARKHSAQGVSINLQCYVNREKLLIPLSVYVQQSHFDKSKELVTRACNEAMYHNQIIANARTRAMAILTESNEKSIKLNRDSFRYKFTRASGELDFIAFCDEEINRKAMAVGTYRQHRSWLKKLTEFKKVIYFDEISRQLVIDFERYLSTRGNGLNTRAIALKNLKAYINAANVYYERSGFSIDSPFASYRITHGKGRIVFCTKPELAKLINYYKELGLSDPLRESLCVFLSACFSSLRISDLHLIEPSWIINKVLTFTPHKTRRFDKEVSFELPKVSRNILHHLFVYKFHKKKLKAETTINADLKLIAARVGIKKNLSMHVGRHTFATNFLTNKGIERGTIEALRDIMGHSRIETTMRYVHVLDETKNNQLKNFDNEFEFEC